MARQSGDGTLPSATRRKVKSGCQTCKRRKIKCDEGWPVCNRCKSTGRYCDGYGIWGGGSQNCSTMKMQISDKKGTSSITGTPDSGSLTLTRALPLVSLSTTENDAFEWFMCRTALKLPGVFPSQYWNTLLFQASTTEVSIRHALLALSSAHKEEVRSAALMGREDNDTLALFTVKQYSKAIRSVQSCLGDSRQAAKRIALISCLLFVSTEFLRGCYTNGLLHLENGLNMLLEQGPTFQNQDYHSTCVDGWLITFFTRFLVQAKLWGQLPGLPCQRCLVFGQQRSSTVPFKSIHHARRSLEQIILGAMDISERSSELLVTRASYRHKSQVLVDEQSQLRNDLRSWLQIYEANIPQSSFIVTLLNREHFAYRLLRFYHDLATIQVETCVDAFWDEKQYDHHRSTFVQIISFCVQACKAIHGDGKKTQHPQAHLDPEPDSPNSVSDIGWIAPLYFTAIKCRDHRLRWQAIHLLESSMQREGIWSSTLAVAVARKVVETEEGSFYESVGGVDCFDKMDMPTDRRSGFLPTLPVDRRVGSIGIVLPDDKAGTLVFSCYRQSNVARWIVSEYDLRTGSWTDSAWYREIKDLSCQPPGCILSNQSTDD